VVFDHHTIDVEHSGVVLVVVNVDAEALGNNLVGRVVLTK
jgi:hypothetical protein